jgi:glycosyltransferase involved in cell wall biosynthesis
MENKKNIKILIATGIFPPDIGGPAQYAKRLAEELSAKGNDVKILSYSLEKRLPPILRHGLYFFRVFFSLAGVDLIIALDTFSVGLPAAAAAKLLGKKVIIRVGGDFLWESYVERTGDLIKLREFYDKKPALSDKENIILYLTRLTLKICPALVFSTDWQKNIWSHEYNIGADKLFVIENFYGRKIQSAEPKHKNFIWAGRLLKLKNIEVLRSAFDKARITDKDIFLETYYDLSLQELLEKLRTCYAVILPSLTDVSPNFILDAMVFNRPFILTKETGFLDKLKDVGIFIDPLNSEEIEKKILFLANKEHYDDYKKKIAEYNFTHSWQEIAGEFINIYENL